MRIRGKRRVLLLGLFCLMGGACNLWAQQDYPVITKFIADIDESSGRFFSARPLEPRELLLGMGEQIRSTELDCSHFVQWLFEQAGLYYDYAPSRTIYDGMDGFKRVYHPRPGDLIVWPGHVGIVVDPDETTFLSALRSGVKTASYTSHYWKRRGRPRFFRYVGGYGNFPSKWQPVAATNREARAAAGAQ